MEQSLKVSIWHSIEHHAISVCSHSTSSLKQKRQAGACGIDINYSDQHLTGETLTLLFALADACHLQEKIDGLMRGDNVNLSEARPALHTALRVMEPASILVDYKNIMDDIFSTRNQMKDISEKIRAGLWLGYSGEPISDIVNIGMGGSDLGPRFCMKALDDYSNPNLGYHFISDADPSAFKKIVSKLQPETTLFIVASKSFTTQETLFNARKAKAWIGDVPGRIEQHFIAVTAQAEKALRFGMRTILPIWDWVGGRYSLCSAINLITVIAIGFEQFNQLLAGANSMDKHFRDAKFDRNLPVLLALIGIWNNNFLNIHNLLMLTYSQSLDQLVPYIQQLDMESNGKSVDNKNNEIDCATGPLVWGGAGNQAQHSYYQLLCQGTHKVAVDFIILNGLDGEMINDMCADKIRVLTHGVNAASNPSSYIRGGTPLSLIQLADCSPFSIGALIALYEHKVFVQSVIWDINPFDQPGVDSAKRDRKTSSLV